MTTPFAYDPDRGTFRAGERVFPALPHKWPEGCKIPLGETGWVLSAIWWNGGQSPPDRENLTLKNTLDIMLQVLDAVAGKPASYSNWPDDIEVAILDPQGQLQMLLDYDDAVADHVTPDQFCALYDEWSQIVQVMAR